MVSNLRVSHLSGQFFDVTHSDFQETAQKFPSLLDDDSTHVGYSGTVTKVIDRRK
jgi:hypothetical protein